MKVKRNQKGFTLIEVVLVLAIGGLIFLLAFLAFQQVSRNRRDTQRRSDAARMAATYNDVVGDVGGSITAANAPYAQAGWVAAIANPSNKFVPPSEGATYTYQATGTLANANTFRVTLGNATTPPNKCDGTTPMTNPAQGKVELKLEGSGIVCRDTD